MYKSSKLNKTVFPDSMLMLAKTANKLGYQVEWIDRHSGYLLRINGKYFGTGHMPKFPLNSAVARALVKDKVFSYLLMEAAGINVPEGNYFLHYNPFYDDHCRGRGLAEAKKYARQLGYPLIVKPNSQSLGRHCRLIFNAKSLLEHLQTIWQEDHVALVQRQVAGKEYRLVVLDGKIILGYQKEPPVITGDGQKTVEQLVKLQIKKRPKTVADREYIKHQGYGLASVLPPNKTVFISANANLSTGGRIVSEIASYPVAMQKYVKKIAQIFDLRLYGLDLMLDDIMDAQTYTVIEVNGDPGLNEYFLFDPKRAAAVNKAILQACF